MKLGELRKLAEGAPPLEGAALQQWLQEKMRAMGMDPGKLYQELEMSLRFVEAHRDISFSNAQLHLHSHNFYELLFCCNSCGAEYLVGAERYRLQEGDIVFVPPGISHRPLLPDHMSAPYKRYVLWLSTEFMDFYSHMFSDPTQPTPAPMLRPAGSAREALAEAFRTCIREAEQQAKGWEAAIVGNAMQLLSLLRRNADTQAWHTVTAEKPGLLDQLTEYVETHYMSRLTIAQAAKTFFVSNSTVSHLFQQKLGVSFYRYVTQRRLIAAKSLIESGAHLEHAALQSGFQDYSGFYRAFRQEYGISPRQYRQLQTISRGDLLLPAGE